MRIALLTTVCLATVALAESDEAQKAKVEKQVEGIKKAAEREARSSSPEGCKELLAESRVACGEVFTRGLKLNCMMMTTALGMAAKQAKGELFKTGGNDVRAANASCRVHLRTVRKAKEKGADLPDASQAPEACRDLAAAIDTRCFGGFEQTGTFDNGCGYVFRSTLSPAVKPQCDGLLKALSAVK